MLPQAAFEDVEFCVRAVKGGIHICYESDAVVRHRYDCTAVGLFRCRARARARPTIAFYSLLIVVLHASSVPASSHGRYLMAGAPVAQYFHIEVL